MLRIEPRSDPSTRSTYVPSEKRCGDLTLHIDEVLDDGMRQILQAALMRVDGVDGVVFQERHPHLLVIRYDVFRVSSRAILKIVEAENLVPHMIHQGVDHRIHAQIVGL